MSIKLHAWFAVGALRIYSNGSAFSNINDHHYFPKYKLFLMTAVIFSLIAQQVKCPQDGMEWGKRPIKPNFVSVTLLCAALNHAHISSVGLGSSGNLSPLFGLLIKGDTSCTSHLTSAGCSTLFLQGITYYRYFSASKYSVERGGLQMVKGAVKANLTCSVYAL